MKIPDDQMFKERDGPMAKVRTCLICQHAEIVRKTPKGLGLGIGPGRGYGLREGNKARGRMIQHFKAAHPERYEQLRRIEKRAQEIRGEGTKFVSWQDARKMAAAEMQA